MKRYSGCEEDVRDCRCAITEDAEGNYVKYDEAQQNICAYEAYIDSLEHKLECSEAALKIHFEHGNELEAEVKRLKDENDSLEFRRIMAEDNLKVFTKSMNEMTSQVAYTRHALRKLCIGACNCLTKTPDPKYHSDTCNYRIAKEALEAI